MEHILDSPGVICRYVCLVVVVLLGTRLLVPKIYMSGHYSCGDLIAIGVVPLGADEGRGTLGLGGNMMPWIHAVALG